MTRRQPPPAMKGPGKAKDRELVSKAGQRGCICLSGEVPTYHVVEADVES